MKAGAHDPQFLDMTVKLSACGVYVAEGFGIAVPFKFEDYGLPEHEALAITSTMQLLNDAHIETMTDLYINNRPVDKYAHRAAVMALIDTLRR